MAIVNHINIKTSKITSCDEFGNAFTNIILNEAKRYDKIRVVFGWHDDKSLETYTRAKQTHGISVQYCVTKEIQIWHLITKEFLSSIVPLRLIEEKLGGEK